MRGYFRCFRAVALALVWAGLISASEPDRANLLRHGDFATLDGWEQNATLRQFGKVALLARDRGVRIENSHHTLDGTLAQAIGISGPTWLEVSCRIMHGANTGASLAVVALDRSGKVLETAVPFKLGAWNSTRWDGYRKTLSIPQGTAAVRVELAVLSGSCSFADVVAREVPKPVASGPRMQILEGKGFAVQRLEVERPLWEMLVDDLDGDGRPELAACDVDGRVTIRRPGEPPSASYEPGAMVFNFAAADLDGDGKKELLMTTLDTRKPMRVIDLTGRALRPFSDAMCHRRIEAADMDGDGRPEVAAAMDGGVALFDGQGKRLWQTEYRLSDFHFADVDPQPGIELVVAYGGPRTEFEVFDLTGKRIGRITLSDDRRVFLRQFRAADLDGDGTQEIVVLRDDGSVLCLGQNRLVWRNTLPEGLLGDMGIVRIGDFCAERPGPEIFVAGTHYQFVLDARGTIVYRSSAARKSASEAMRQWMPEKLRPMTAAFWGKGPAELYLGSSGFRDPAYYVLRFGAKDELQGYKVPDGEKHLDAIYRAVKSRAPLATGGDGKFKIVYVRGWGRESEESLRKFRQLFDRLETPRLEFTLMYDPSDLKAHPRGQKMTTDEIVQRARLFERLRLPFGYFAVHGCQAWISDEAIRRSIEAAPSMFRYLYVAEDTESFYEPHYKPFLEWCARMLDLCSRHGKKVLFKEKHDTWGVIASDPEVAAVLFQPKYRDTIVPLYSTNQVYQPEVQWGGMLGLKLAGYCNEFGMSTQWWNWGEWDNREMNAAFVCPSDITLRLELLGAALGGTWFHIEGGQPYLADDSDRGFLPLVTRHRDLVYELMRKNILDPSLPLANENQAVIARSFHPEFQRAKAEQRKIIYAYDFRNVPALRDGLLHAARLFEPYLPYAFPRLAYGSEWNGITCFPTSPLGWVPIAPADARLPSGALRISTDGERVRIGENWRTAHQSAESVQGILTRGASKVPIRATEACTVVRGPLDPAGRRYRVWLIDPGYLAPRGVQATVEAPAAATIEAVDLVTGQPVRCAGNRASVAVEPGAFRVLDVTLTVNGKR